MPYNLTDETKNAETGRIKLCLRKYNFLELQSSLLFQLLCSSMNQFEGINSKTSVILPISSLIANKKLLLNTLSTIAYFLITNKPPF